MLFVDGIRSEEGVTPKVALDVVDGVKRDERTQGKVHTNLRTFQFDEIPLRPNEWIMLVTYAFLGGFAAAPRQIRVAATKVIT